MSFSFTPGQKLAIESRGSALLVSAAAGSGKTRVLTERLLRYVTDPESPVDVNRFLVITYTRAAAAELRARILSALAEQAAANPGDTRLRRQQNLCCQAPIGTIHSFCTSVLREYSHQLGLSPSFAVLEEGRAEQLKRSALTRLLEQHYEHIHEDDSFRLLADTVGYGRDDRALEDAVLRLYDRLRSHPDPEAWVQQQRTALLCEGIADVGETPWGTVLLARGKVWANYWIRRMEAALEEIYAAEDGGVIAAAYGPGYAETADSLREFRRALELGWEPARAGMDIVFSRLGTVKKTYPNPEFKERIKSIRDACKKACDKMKDMFSRDSAELLAELRSTAPAMQTLLELTLELDRSYSAEKRRRSTLDFSDLEHEAARLLYDPAADGPTAAARELSARFVEVMVDEYQDVNAVQELIFRCLSRQEQNLFMVGDVKQSIYRFRLADPTLFLEKYRSYAPAETAQPGEPRRILLQENFRSRRPVLDAANRVFSAIMSRDLGELDYDEAAALKFGAQGYAPTLDTPVEMHIIASAAASEDADDERPDSGTAEARFIARTILDMVRRGVPVTEGGTTRPCGWGDFVLLMRGTKSKGALYRRVLAEAGVPVENGRSDSFFESLEVSVMVDLLTVLDNPHADIPLISVLRSPIFGFTPDELSTVRIADRSSDFFGALRSAAAAGNAHCAAVLERLSRWRALAPELGLDALVWRLCGETGLFALCAAMRDGMQRRQNLMQLFSYARRFLDSGDRGVYRFVRWLRRLAEKNEHPEDSTPGQCVRIMSIHKSKGLEFPFVFLCDLGTKFNLLDTYADVLIHTELGLGPQYVDPDRGIKYSTFARNAIAQQMTTETLSEEMRILYVGMTRAKERLLLTCEWKDPETTLTRLMPDSVIPVDPETLRSAGNFSKWLALVSLAQPEALPLHIHTESEADEELSSAAADETEAADTAAREAAEAALAQQLDFVYPWAGSVELPTKLTATELKGRQPADPDASPLREEPEAEYSFRMPEPGRERALSPAQRGTATHAFLQYVDLSATEDISALEAEAQRLTSGGQLLPEQAAVLDFPALARFFASPLGLRLRQARQPRREFRFLLLADAAEYFPAAAAEDQLLLQGVVDCCFEEADGLVLLDYKTDRINAAQVPERAEHYRGQLQVYARALERVLHKPVAHCFLWFLRPGTEFELTL